VGHALEGRTGPFQVKTAVIFARLFGEDPQSANPTLNAMEVIAVGLGLTVFELFERVRDVAQVQPTSG
jgi:hypothetical protein